MAVIGNIKGIQNFLTSLDQQLEMFQKGCAFISEQATQGKYTIATATAESDKLLATFRGILENIESAQSFLCQEGDLKEDSEVQFLALTEIDHKLRNCFSKTCENLGKIQATIPIKAIDILKGTAKETTSRVFVYYAGKGDLFIRGQEAQVPAQISSSTSLYKPVELGNCEDLSWNRGLPLTKLADHFWTATIIAKEGQVPKYKFLVWDVTLSTNEEPYEVKGAKTMFHIPTFDDHSTSLVVPIKVEFGDTLKLFGTGTVVLNETPIELSWGKGIDFTCFGPNLWVLPLEVHGDVTYKVCLVKESNEIIWEIGPNRHLASGKELVLTPNFGPQIGRIQSMETASASLGTHLLDSQKEIEETLTSAQEQQTAIRKPGNSQAPDLLRGAGMFSQNEILKVNEVFAIKPIVIEGEEFFIYFTQEGKSLKIQENRNGCTAGVSSMLIIDNGKLPCLADLKYRQGSNGREVIEADLKKAGLVPLVTPCADFGKSLLGLRNLLLKHGSAYVSIRKALNHQTTHAIIVDEISIDLSRVRIRDPWNAYDFIVDAEAFKRVWGNSPAPAIIQVKDGVK